MKLQLLTIKWQHSDWKLTIFSAGRYLPSALCQYCGPLDTRSQYHGLSLGRHFLFFLAKNAGEHLPVSWSGPSVGPDGYTQLHMLHCTTRGISITQSRISQIIWCGSHTSFNHPWFFFFKWSSSPLRSCNRLALYPALWHVVIQHLVWLNEVLLHRWHLGHNLLPVEFGCLCLPFALSFLFVLSTLE